MNVFDLSVRKATNRRFSVPVWGLGHKRAQAERTWPGDHRSSERDALIALHEIIQGAIDDIDLNERPSE